MKESMQTYLDRKREASVALDIEFRTIFEDLNEDHNKLLSMARVAKYELIMKMLEEEDDPGTDIAGEDEEEESS